MDEIILKILSGLSILIGFIAAIYLSTRVIGDIPKMSKLLKNDEYKLDEISNKLVDLKLTEQSFNKNIKDLLLDFFLLVKTAFSDIEISAREMHERTIFGLILLCISLLIQLIILFC